MGGCCCGSHHADARQPLTAAAHGGGGGLGPVQARRCTDVCCCLIFLGFSTFLLAVSFYVDSVSDARLVAHGMDHEGAVCGFGDRAGEPYKYFPDLHHDIELDPSLRSAYGLCVSSCPEPGSVVLDSGSGARQDAWVVTMPSFPVLGRCIPYEPKASTNSTLLCGQPACTATPGVPPTVPTEVCGLRRDGTDKYWLLSPPDESMVDGWRAEGVSEDAILNRTAVAAAAAKSGAAKSCRQPLRRDSSVHLRPADDTAAYKLLTAITGPAIEAYDTCYQNRVVILGLGLGGALVLSLVLLSVFSFLAKVVMTFLVMFLEVILIVGNYILFVQAGIATGRTGGRVRDFIQRDLHIDVPDGAEALLHQGADSGLLSSDFYAAAAVLMVVGNVLLLCLLCALQPQFKKLINLMREASHVVQAVPSLLIFPFLVLLCMVVSTAFMLRLLVGISTTIESKLPIQFDTHEHFEHAQALASLVAVLGGLWWYFFLVAVFHTTVAHTVTRWYFQDDGAGHHPHFSLMGCLGVPVVKSLFTILWYHIGSMAAGAFLMAIFTLPRLLFEYVVRQSKKAQENQLARLIVNIIRCITWCVQKFLEFLTEYAYVHVAVFGEPFCPAAKHSWRLLTKYPVLVALEKFTYVMLGWLSCTAVPAALVVAAWFVGVRENSEVPACSLAIAALAYVTTRLAVGVYDSCVTALLVCVVRDTEFSQAQHMERSHMSQGLRGAFGLEDDPRAPVLAGEGELASVR